MNKETKRMTFYSCPVCGMNSTDKKEIQDHFRTHTIKSEEWVYCRACGAGWSVAAYGLKSAAEQAKNCYNKHISEGNLTETAERTFFLSGGEFGFLCQKRGRHKRMKGEPRGGGKCPGGRNAGRSRRAAILGKQTNDSL